MNTQRLFGTAVGMVMLAFSLSAPLAAETSTPPSMPGATLPPTLVVTPSGGWMITEGTGTAIADTNIPGNAGTLQGSATWITNSAGPKTLQFNGGYIDIPKPVVDTSQSFTVSAWVKVHVLKGIQTFVSIDGSQISGFYLQVNVDNKFCLTIHPKDASDQTGKVSVISNLTVKPDTWYHLVGVHNAETKTVAIYVNGVIQQMTSFRSPWRAMGHTEIGRAKYSGNAVDFVDGTIFNVRFYNKAFSASEIAALATGKM